MARCPEASPESFNGPPQSYGTWTQAAPPARARAHIPPSGVRGQAGSLPTPEGPSRRSIGQRLAIPARVRLPGDPAGPQVDPDRLRGSEGPNHPQLVATQFEAPAGGFGDPAFDLKLIGTPLLVESRLGQRLAWCQSMVQPMDEREDDLADDGRTRIWKDPRGGRVGP